MRALIAAVAIASALVVPQRARSQGVTEATLDFSTSPASPADDAAAPWEEAPNAEPAPPPAVVPEPPAQAEAPAASVPAGEWVYTEQYGWIWMPYADSYTHVPQDNYGQPYQYVYYPVYGWTWVYAPWIWGWGPWPYFVSTPVYFGWYVHGYWQYPSHYHPYPSPYHGYGPAAPRRGWAPAVPPSRHATGGYYPSRSASPRAAYPATPPPSYRAPAPAFHPPAAGFRGPVGGGGVQAAPSRGGSSGGAPSGFRGGGGMRAAPAGRR